jgi:putative flippase GtrA
MFDQLYRRYIAASVAALSVDFAIFVGALRLGILPVAAAAAGYLAGVVCHWLISSRAVFIGRVSESPVVRRQQQAMFLGSALVGLAITTAIVGLGTWLGVYPLLAKVIAIGVSFQVTYLLRKKVVFA